MWLLWVLCVCFFFFKQKTAYEMRISDWSSDVCSSDLLRAITGRAPRWFRAVVGHANPFVSAPLRDCGLARVAWDARAFDAVRSDPPAVVARLERELAPGAIVLLHECARHGRNVEMIGVLLQSMQALGQASVLPADLRSAAPRVWHTSVSTCASRWSSIH